MARITISYRRDDSGVITGRIFDRLVAHFGREAVFRDIDDIPPGVDFRQHIGQILDQSNILLAIVGPRWLGPRGGQSRLDDEADPVRVEIEIGLRKQMPVIPVLVLRAAMPRVAQLPDSVKDFAYRHAVQVDAGQDFDVHAARLIRAMDRILRLQQGKTMPAEPVDEGPLAVVEPPAAVEQPPIAEPEPVAPPPAPPPMAAPRVAAEAPRRAEVAIGAVAGLAIGALVAGGLVAYLRPGAPADVLALATAKQAAEAEQLTLQAELAAAQEKLGTTQSSLDSAQAAAGQASKDLAAQHTAAANAQAQIDQLAAQVKTLGDQQARASRLADQLADARKQLDGATAQLSAAQARADKAETDEKQLAAQVSSGQDKGAAAQKLLDQASAQLADANARADQSDKELAAQKAAARDAASKAQAQVSDLQGQLKNVSDQFAAEKKAHQEAVAQLTELDDKLKASQSQATALPNAAATAAAPAGPAPAPEGNDGDWSVDQRRRAQADLIALGYLQGTADGNFGPSSRASIKAYQSIAGDPETGVMSDSEATALHDASARLAALLARGETSPDGVTAAAVKGAAQRYQRAWAAEKGGNGAADPAEAAYWYGLAAADGDSKALTNLGTLLVRGQGVAKPDPEGAALLWEVAAAHGETTAMFNLGAMYEHGVGVAADPAKAKAWYQHAATKGDPGARAALKRLGA